MHILNWFVANSFTAHIKTTSQVKMYSQTNINHLILLLKPPLILASRPPSAILDEDFNNND